MKVVKVFHKILGFFNDGFPNMLSPVLNVARHTLQVHRLPVGVILL